MALLNLMIVLTFNYIQGINEQNVKKIHQERSMLLLMSSFEKLQSSRDSFVNHNRKNGWSEFTKLLANQNSNTKKYFIIKQSKESSENKILNQWYLEETSSDAPEIFSSEVAPYADYKTEISAKFEKAEKNLLEEENQVAIFEVKVSWRDDIEDSRNYHIAQEFRLSNYKIYENLY